METELCTPASKLPAVTQRTSKRTALVPDSGCSKPSVIEAKRPLAKQDRSLPKRCTKARPAWELAEGTDPTLTPVRQTAVLNVICSREAGRQERDARSGGMQGSCGQPAHLIYVVTKVLFGDDLLKQVSLSRREQQWGGLHCCCVMCDGCPLRLLADPRVPSWKSPLQAG